MQSGGVRYLAVCDHCEGFNHMAAANCKWCDKRLVQPDMELYATHVAEQLISKGFFRNHAGLVIPAESMRLQYNDLVREVPIVEKPVKKPKPIERYIITLDLFDPENHPLVRQAYTIEPDNATQDTAKTQ